MTRALVVINGDDVYEDLFSAGLKLAEILVSAGFAVRTAFGTGRLGEAAYLVVLCTALGYFPPDRQAALFDAVRGGTGLLAVHATNVSPGPVYRLIGSRFVSHGPAPHESRFRVETDPDHPVTRHVRPFEVTHEHYQVQTAGDVRIVAWRRGPAGREPVAYVRREGLGRVCYLQLGHDMRTWDEPAVRDIVANAARWAGLQGTAR